LLQFTVVIEVQFQEASRIKGHLMAYLKIIMRFSSEMEYSSGLNEKASHPDKQKIRKLDFSLTISYIGILNWGKFSTNGYFRLHIYLRTNKTLMHNSLFVFEN